MRGVLIALIVLPSDLDDEVVRVDAECFGKRHQDVLHSLFRAVVVRLALLLEDVNHRFGLVAVHGHVVFGDVSVVDPVTFDTLAFGPSPPLLLVLLDAVGKHLSLLARFSPSRRLRRSIDHAAHGNLDEAALDRSVVQNVTPGRS